MYKAGCTSSVGFSSISGASCNGTTTPVVTTPSSNGAAVLTIGTPNGGQTYQAGQSINVQWGGENIPVANAHVYITLQQYDTSGNPLASTTLSSATINGTQETVTLPTGINGSTFKLSVGIANSSNAVIASDLSDNYFTITASSVSIPVTPTYLPGCTSTSGYSSVNGLACNGSHTVATPTSVSSIPTSSVCNLTVSGVSYTLNPCTISKSMVDGQGNQQVTVSVVPNNSSASYGFSVRGNPVGFPTYAVMSDVSSGGASGTTTLHLTFNDQYLSAGTYNGVLPIHIFTGSEANDGSYLALGINVSVTSPVTVSNSSSSTSSDAGCNGTKYSSTSGALCTNY